MPREQDGDGADGDIAREISRRACLSVAAGAVLLADGGSGREETELSGDRGALPKVRIDAEVRHWEHPDHDTRYHLISQLARLHIYVEDWGSERKITVERHGNRADSTVSRIIDGEHDTTVIPWGGGFTVRSDSGYVFFEGTVTVDNKHLVDEDSGPYQRTYAPEEISARLNLEVDNGV